MNERDIFQAALDISDPTERSTYLDTACQGDIVLQDRIARLLASHSQSPEDFLASPFQTSAVAKSLNANAPTMDANINSLRQTESKQFDLDDEIAESTAPDLSFLQPPIKPGSIGTLGHYVILELLGQGAFGIVFKAFDEKLHRMVAIKAMNPTIAATSPPRKRFLREARSAAAIKHENIVQVYSVEEQPIPYLVMEYVEGQSLQDKLDNSGPLELIELLYLGKQIAAGLAAAHNQGLVHRDIKPANILIENGNEQKIKITDFGLARAADDASMTQTGFISGTPLYMAPEQALGHTLDHRADLFSFGSVLYQMSCGRPPFRAPSTLAILRRVVDDSPRPIQEIIPEVPVWMSALITRLHAKNPDDRFQTAKEVVTLFDSCLAHVQNPSREGLPAELINSNNRTNDEIDTTEQSGAGESDNATNVKKIFGNRSKRGKWVLTFSGMGAICLIALLVYLIQLKSPSSIEKRSIESSQSDHKMDTLSNHSQPLSTPSSTTIPENVIPNTIISDEYKWSEPENLGPEVNTDTRELCANVTDNELLLVFSRQGTFYQATRESRDLPFSQVKRLEGPFAEKPIGEPSCSISGDGLIIAFSSGAVGETVDDILFAVRNDQNEPFGPTLRPESPVNSDGYERHPVLSRDGLQLAVTVSRSGIRKGSALLFERASRTDPFLNMRLDPNLQDGWGVVSCFAGDNSGLLKSTLIKDTEMITWHSRDPIKGTYSTGIPLQPPFDKLKYGQPQLSADGMSLYYHSRALQDGFGELDLWVSRRIPVK